MALGIACAACVGDERSDSAPAIEAELTQRQRDSLLAQSRLPGARGVGAAMRAADTIEARLRTADTIGQ
jgi:hypothetical protein